MVRYSDTQKWGEVVSHFVDSFFEVVVCWHEF
jgi:hypothetical protein